MRRPQFRYSPSPVIVPKRDCPWAETMCLNPAIIKDPDSSMLHMLFRASGPCPQMQRKGQPLPYPIFLGYAASDDNGETWDVDFSRPALAPALRTSADEIYITNRDGRRVVDYANGLVEDARLTSLEGTLYMIVAGRLFPPGPFWEHDEPMQCAPDWARSEDQPFGRAGSENLAVSILYEVHLDKLKKRDYANAFSYLTHVTDPERGDNRDVFLFPEKMVVGSREQYVCVHRPREPWRYPGGQDSKKPTIYLSAADSLYDLATDNATQSKLAEPMFDWEEERVGGSWPPIRVGDDEWLLAYHGKKDDVLGYTQSFMILKQRDNDLPAVVHRCSERMMYAQQEWELPRDLEANVRPCLFSCGGVVVNGTLIISYGASDERVGIAWVDLEELVAFVKQFDALGRRRA